MPPTITNRSTLSKGYTRSRKNVSRRLRTISLGRMTQSQFNSVMDAWPSALLARLKFHNNTCTIHKPGNQMERYSFIRIPEPRKVAAHIDLGNLAYSLCP